MSLLWATGLAAFAFWLAWSAERRTWLPRTRIGYAAGTVVAASALATVFSLSPALSLVGFSTRFGGLIPTLLYAATMVAVLGLFWERPDRLRRLVWAIALASEVVAVSVLLQQAGVDRVLWAGPVAGTLQDYPPGTVGYSNFAGAQLALAVPCLCYLISTARNRFARSALGAALALGLVALWFTHSRGAMLAAVVGAGAMGLASRDRLGRWAKALLGLSVAAAVAAAVVVVWHPGTAHAPSRLVGAETLDTKTLRFRLDYWRAAVEILLDHPVVGTGPDTFYATYPQHRSAEAGAGAFAVLQVDKAHNIFLERAATSGALGGSSYLVLVGLALRYGYRHRRQLEGEARLLLACFVGLLAAYLAQGFFSIDEPSLAVVGWVALGAIAAMADPVAVAARYRSGADAAPPSAKRTRGVVSTPQTKAPSPRWVVHLLVAAALVSLVVVGLRPLEADVQARSGRLEQAVRLNPLNALYRAALANQAVLAGGATTKPHEKERLLGIARDQYLQALRLQPGEVSFMVGIANVETTWGSDLDPEHFGAADAWWRSAMRHDPSNQILRQSYGRELPAAEQRTVLRLETDTRINPGEVANWVNLAKAYFAVDEPAKARAALNEVLRLDPGNKVATSILAPKRR